jgi:pimeloyl-ACP methyl ester carboxylesterase
MTTLILSALLGSAPAEACSRSTYPSVQAWIPCATPGTACVLSPYVHFTGRPATNDPEQREHLVVYLPGGGSRPSHSEAFLRTAVKYGYHTIGLAVKYGFHTIGLAFDTENASNATNPCKAMTSEPAAQDCYHEIRNRFAYGTHDPAFPAYRSVQAGDDVMTRLDDLLAYAEITDVNGRWEDFRDANGDPDFSKIILVGWSFGAGIGQHIAKDTEVQAMIMIDGVMDPYYLNPPAPLVPNPMATPLVNGATPGCRYWGVYDANGDDPAMLLQQFTNVGMLAVAQPTPPLPPVDAVDLDGSTTDTWGVAGADDRRFFTAQTCCSTPGTCFDTSIHSTFTVQADTFADIDAASCTKYAGGGGEYHLRGLYEDILCTADTEACTNGGPDILPSP